MFFADFIPIEYRSDSHRSKTKCGFCLHMIVIRVYLCLEVGILLRGRMSANTVWCFLFLSRMYGRCIVAIPIRRSSYVTPVLNLDLCFCAVFVGSQSLCRFSVTCLSRALQCRRCADRREWNCGEIWTLRV